MGMYSLDLRSISCSGAVGALLVHLLADQVAVGDDLIHRALKLATLLETFSAMYLAMSSSMTLPHWAALFFDDGKARFKIGRLDVDEQAPLEAGLKTVVEQLHLLGRAVGGEDDLALGLVEGIEGMEELLLRLLAAGDDIAHRPSAGGPRRGTYCGTRHSCRCGWPRPARW